MTTPLVELVMTRNPAVISPDDSLHDAIERMRERDCRRLPVLENGKLIGIVTDRDLRRATNSPFVMQERWYNEFILNQVPVRACMSRDPQTVSPSTPLVEAARLMRDRKIGGLPVVEGDALVGIITETDLFKYLIQILEG